MGPQIEPFPVSKTARQQAPPKKGLLPHLLPPSAGERPLLPWLLPVMVGRVTKLLFWRGSVVGNKLPELLSRPNPQGGCPSPWEGFGNKILPLIGGSCCHADFGGRL